MKIKRAVGIMLIICLCLCLGGCSLVTVNTEELLSPPALSGEMGKIKKALDESVDTAVTLKYPSAGEYRSPVILRDLNGDGTNEAIIFYTTSDRELTSINLSLIKYSKKKKKWQVMDRQTLTGAGVEKVEFSDLDGDGTEEILAGFEIYAATEKQLAVYSLTDKALLGRMLERYTTFITCDLDEDKNTEILLEYLDTSALTNTASLIKLDKGGTLTTAQCLMDGNVKTVNPPMLSTLSNGKPAVYFDEIKGVGAITEVLFVSGGELKNPLYDADAGENRLTLRDSVLMTQDIDGDKLLEIPIAYPLQNADITSPEKLYYTYYSSYNGEQFVEKKISIVNIADSYRLDIPESWLGNIAVDKKTSTKERTIYSYNPETPEVVSEVARIKTVTQNDFKNGRGFDKDKAIEIARNQNLVYLLFLPQSVSGEIRVNEKQIKKMLVPTQIS